jgi:hypothetical protein
VALGLERLRTVVMYLMQLINLSLACVRCHGNLILVCCGLARSIVCFVLGLSLHGF